MSTIHWFICSSRKEKAEIKQEVTYLVADYTDNYTD